MKVGIIGLPQTGKKTLFKILTAGHGMERAADARKTLAGSAEIKDPRFDVLVEHV